MKCVEYRGELLATTSYAYELLQEWRKATDTRLKSKAKDKLDGHLKQINLNKTNLEA